MKRFIKILFMATAVITAASGCASQKSASGNEMPGLKEAIETRNYEISVRQAFPASGKSIYLSSDYSLKTEGDKVTSVLPYFGRAYSAPYGGGDGLRFEGEMTGYTIKYGSKNKADISFNVRTREDNYRFHITIFPNGHATINVGANNRQSISFNGEVLTKDTQVPEVAGIINESAEARDTEITRFTVSLPPLF